ncbi:branched-chain amino acid ABC transporter substrate-binding protein [Roseibium aggregatum]|uniref:Branched-chain amino acid ABC transporter substrate-binding protein n=1 Tax=Roseibium aggregatum TaxID=187304 RepID=A0A939EE67_9HYPH|nr:branched-chain amino acid ABC transporter substrate-binding protein [Roseibium aggregatum]MBN9671119.1 branched-chain amino acid ABC transporter substrate-binding protein [Roseibium aggregatum]
MTYRQLAAVVPLLVSGLLPGSALADIRIAIAGPMKGQFAPFGAQMKAGAEQAIADINAAGGVNGEALVLEIADDACNEDRAVAVANQLIGRSVRFVAGHFCFGASVPASEVYAGAGIVQISPATTLPRFTDDRPGKGIYRLAPRDDGQAKIAGRFLAEEMSGKRIAILHDKTAYGKGLTDAVKATMNGLGENEVLALGFDAGQDSYNRLVSRLALEGIEVVYLGGYHPEAALIALEIARQGLDAVLVSGDALMSEDFWLAAGAAGNGTLLTYPEVPRNRPEAADLVKALEEAGASADRYALTTYAAIQTWAQAAETAGSFELGAVAEVLDEGTFETVLGAVSFDARGDADRPAYVWYEWRDGTPKRK